MYEHKIPKDLSCGMAITMEIMGNKWKACLLYNIHQGIRRPGQLQQNNSRASRQVLSQQLKELEAHGMIGKTVYAEIPMRVEYHLTELGHSLIPVLKVMSDWGREYGQKKMVSHMRPA